VTHDAAAAHAIDDVDRLADFLLEQRADDPRRGVGAAARRPRDDQRDRPLGIGGLCDGRAQKYADAGQDCARDFDHDSSVSAAFE
jgi:hypothetical protein